VRTSCRRSRAGGGKWCALASWLGKVTSNYNQRAVRLIDRVAVAKGMQQLAGAARPHYKAKAYVMRDGGCGRSVRWD
jgi:hypothetical protein